MEIPTKCPICGGDLWDNREKKASGKFKPKSPDFSCRNEECKHGIWLFKEEKIPLGLKQEPTILKTEVTKDTFVEGKKENTQLMCRKDLMVALINQGMTTRDNITELFDTLWKKINE